MLFDVIGDLCWGVITEAHGWVTQIARQIQMKIDLYGLYPLHFRPPGVELRQPIETGGFDPPERDPGSALVCQRFAEIDVGVGI